METINKILNDAAFGIERIYDNELEAEFLEKFEGAMRIPLVGAGEYFINNHQAERVRLAVRAKQAVLRADGGGKNGECELGICPPDLPDDAE